MDIIDDYKQLRMIEALKEYNNMKVCYKENLKLCKWQEQQINRLATAIEKIAKLLMKQDISLNKMNFENLLDMLIKEISIMTDKQIIDKVNVKECKYYCNGKCERYEEFVEADYADYSVKCICEEENVLGTYDICDYQQLKAKEQECNKLYTQLKADEEYHKEEENTLRKIIKNKEKRNIELYKENNKLKQTLTEIKPILEFYANSKMGEEQPDKTYHIMLNGGYIMVYDPKPASQALQEIRQIIKEDNQ